MYICDDGLDDCMLFAVEYSGLKIIGARCMKSVVLEITLFMQLAPIILKPLYSTTNNVHSTRPSTHIIHIDIIMNEYRSRMSHRYTLSPER